MLLIVIIEIIILLAIIYMQHKQRCNDIIHIINNLFNHKWNNGGTLMSGRSSLTITKTLAEKLKIIKEENHCTSMNEVIEGLLPYAVDESFRFKKEV